MTSQPAKIGRIELTETEESLIKEILFDIPVGFGPERTHQNGALAATLFKSLDARKAIPECRLRYFADPADHPRNPRSSKYELFRRNVDSDEELLRNPHFLKYLRYFVCGADLPDVIQETFWEQARGYFVKPNELSTLARELMREMHRRTAPVDRHRLPDEFYKLALDCGCDAEEAKTIRRAVMQVK